MLSEETQPQFDSPTVEEIATARLVLEWLDQDYDGRLVRAVIELLQERTSEDRRR